MGGTDGLSGKGAGRKMSTEGSSQQPDTRFLVAVGGLLLVVIVLLAGLWLRMRRRAERAESQIAELARQRSQIGAAVQQVMAEHAAGLAVEREALEPRRVTLDGRQVTALRLPAGEGERLGFQPGDVILVESAPATAPASGPATRPRP